MTREQDSVDPNLLTRTIWHDFYLSAPKSVSMALHIEADNRVFEAHTKAVKETMDLAEKLLAQARKRLKG